MRRFFNEDNGNNIEFTLVLGNDCEGVTIVWWVATKDLEDDNGISISDGDVVKITVRNDSFLCRIKHKI